MYEKILEELISYLYYDSTNVPNSSEPIKVKTKHDSKTENNTNNQQMIESRYFFNFLCFLTIYQCCTVSKLLLCFVLTSEVLIVADTNALHLL